MRLDVLDNGIGIAVADHPHLFNRFFRANNNVNFAARGVGLGLYITRTVVELHGGHVSVDSELGLAAPSPLSCRWRRRFDAHLPDDSARLLPETPESSRTQNARRNMYAVLLLALILNFACIFWRCGWGLIYGRCPPQCLHVGTICCRLRCGI